MSTRPITTPTPTRPTPMLAPPCPWCGAPLTTIDYRLRARYHWNPFAWTGDEADEREYYCHQCQTTLDPDFVESLGVPID